MSRVAASPSFAFATPADEADLRQLLRDNPMRGAIMAGFTHEPDYFRGTGVAGATDQVLLAREHGRLVAAGRCTTRAAWLNGEVRRVGYLGELRLDASVQGRWDIIRGGYAFFADAYARDPADFCFTSIIADNTRARRLFERGATGLPRYEFIGAYRTLLVPARHRSPALPAGIVRATGADVPLDQLADYLNEAGRTRQLAAHWTGESLAALARHGLQPADFLVLLRGNEIVGATGVWDQQSFRQIQIHGYRPLLAATRPLYNLLAPLLGRPRLPPAGGFLRQAFLTPWACAPGLGAALRQAAGQLAARRGLDVLALGGTAADPELAGLRGHHYPSRLYRVVWPAPGAPVCALDARPCVPDIALL